MTKLLKAPISGGLIQGDMNITEQNISIYSVSNGVPVTDTTVTCKNNNPVFCDIAVSKANSYSNVSRVIMKVIKLSGTAGLSCTVFPANDSYVIDRNVAVGNLSEVIENGVSYCVIDLSAHFFACNQMNFKVAIFTISGEITLDSTSPALEVEYTADNDFIPNVSKIEKNLGPKGSYSLNTRNGKLFYTQQLYHSKGGKLPFALSMTYNPCDAASTIPNGFSSAMKGWTFSYDQTLAFSETDCKYLDGLHRYHTFKPSTNHATVKHDSSLRDGSTLFNYMDGYRISDGKKTTMDFTNNMLSSITVAPGSSSFTTTIARDDSGNITSVTDGLGDTYNFAYTATSIVVQKASQPLVTLTLSNQQVTNVFYHLDQRNVSFTYNDDGFITSATDSLSEEKVVWNYTPIHEVCAVKHYIVGNVDKVTESYHLTYDLLETRVDMCKNSDIKSNKFCSMMYVYATDGQMTHSYELQNEPKNAKINSRGDYSRAIYSAKGDPIVNVTADGYDGTGFAFDAREGDCILTSDTFTLDTDNFGTNLFMLYAQAEIDCRYYCLDPETQFIAMRVKSGATTLSSTTFNVSKRSIQIQGCAFALPSGEHQLTVEFCARGLWGQVSFSKMRIFAMKNGYSKQCVNINTQLNSITEYVDNSAQTVWFDSTKFNLTYDAETITNVRYTVKDHVLTTISRLKDPLCFNLWYNDGENMLSELTGAALTCGTGTFGIGSVKCANVTNADGKTIFNYIQPSSNYLYQENTTIMVEQSGVCSTKYINDNFKMSKVVDEHGISTTYTYDTNGSVTKVKTKAPTGSTMNIEENFTYNDKNLRASSVERRYLDDYTQSFVYGTDYELTKDTQPNGLVTEFAYSADKDKLTRIFATVDNATSQNDISYDGDLVDTLSDTRTAVDFAYDERHNISQVDIAGAAVLSKEITYNANGSTQSITTYGNGQKVKKYYDSYDRLIKVSDVSSGELALVQYIYNDTEIDQSTFNVSTFTPTVSANSSLRVVVDHAANTTTWYTYNEFGQVKKTQSQKLTTTQTLDEFGRVASVGLSFDGNMATYYAYASPTDDTLVSEITVWDIPGEISTTYSRDSLQRPTETKVMQGNYGYKQVLEYIPRQQEVWISTGGQIIKSVPATPNVVPITPLPPISGYWQTTDMGTTQYVSKFKEYSMSGTTATLVRTDTVEYDANGNITKYGDVTYEYDKFGRLTKEINPTIDRIKEWCYDISGNILSRTEHKYTTGEDLGTFAYEYETGWKDQLVEIKKNGVTQDTFDYDNAGNPTTYGEARMEWIRGRLLSSYYIPGNGDYFDMSYSADGKRVQKTQSYDDETSDWVTTYIYNGDNLVCQKEEDGSSTYYKYFLYNSQGIIGYIQDGVTYTYRKNLFGDITAIYQGATKVAEYAYDAWGNCTVTNLTSSKIGSFNPFRYRGYYWDEDLQLYYLMSRYYDPAIGRFINADSLEYLDPETIGGLNMYAYCGNNPIMFSDSTGHAPEWLRNLLSTLLYITSGVIAFAVGTYAGIAAGIATFGAINNLTNAIYYNYISDGESDLTSDSYRYGHINRWDRLDYTKKMTQDQTYNLNAWRYFSEYNFHMYAWYMFGWALDKNIPPLSDWADSAEDAYVDSKDFERDDHGQYTWRNIVYILVGLLGL